VTARVLPGVLTSIVLLAAWLGAAMVVAAVVAPAAFAVLPTRTLAGALVGRILPVIFWSGMAVGLAVVALNADLPARGWRVGSALALAASCAIAQLVIGPRIAAIRSAAGAMEALDPNDPRRIAFGRLHGLSVAWMGAAAVAAIITLILLVRLTTARSTT
jgi:hypothetical protein